MDSNFTFVRTFCERDGTLTSRKIPDLVLNRIEYCSREGDSWKRQIKVAHDIVPRSGTDSGCSSGDGRVSDLAINRQILHHNHISKSRPSVMDPDFMDRKRIHTIQPIESSNNESNGSKLGKILQRFLNPLRRVSKKGSFDIYSRSGGSKDIQKGDNNHRKSSIEESGADHVYETLPDCPDPGEDSTDSEAKYYPPVQKISRKQTLDLLITEFQVDKDGYVIKKLPGEPVKRCLTTPTDVQNRNAYVS